MAFEHIYRPQHKSDQEIVKDFVVRTAVFERLMAEVRKDGPGKLSQHHIVQGLRGMGKSTLFERIRVEMKQPELVKQWLTVKTAEENWPVNSLLDFWIWIGQHMAAVDPAGFGTLSDLGTLWSKDEEHAQCFATMEAKLKGSGRKLLMLVDNVGDLFRKFSKQENHAFREALITSRWIKLVGGTAVRLDELQTHEAPYFDLFKEHHLGGLDQQEVITLLGHYARKTGSKQVEQVVYNEPHRVDHLRILTGGVPRTIMLLLDVFDKDGDATVYDDLRRTLDLVTPLYKHRMDELSPQKQKIVHALAIQWDGMSAGEVAAATRLESKVVSAQLGQLVREGFVLRDETSTKNHFYQLAERFFNIWYLMNNAQRNGAAKVRWLTRFFELWCDEKGLKDKAMKHLAALGRDGVDPVGQILITNALLSSDRLEHPIKELLYDRSASSYPDHTDNILHESQWYEGSASDRLGMVSEAIERLDLDRAERLLSANTDKDAPWVFVFRGDLAMFRGDLPKARKAYEEGLRISTTLAEEDRTNVQAQRDRAFLHWKLFRLGELVNSTAESHLVEYISIVDAMAEKVNSSWKEGDLGNALSMTAQLCGAPLYTGGVLSAILWGVVREQYHGIRELFENRFPRLKEEMRPVYFALLKLMQDEDPDSHRRMGKELEEPVREILARVDEMRKELGKPAIYKASGPKAKASRKTAAKKKRAK